MRSPRGEKPPDRTPPGVSLEVGPAPGDAITLINVLDDTLPAGEAPRPERRGFPPALRARYEDIAFLAEGGSGAIYRARDPRLGRDVAIKLLKHHAPESLRRFLQEARALARVEHEHVCRIYEAGEADGEPFIEMQLVGGEPLGQAAARMSLEQKVKVVREVAAAVHEAHRLGLIHRDIKPGNILVERRDDGSIKPCVVDFGLAREVSREGHAATTTGRLLGTPAYMAPEQALPGAGALDRRTDVYGLGATLYDVLAGRPPFADDNPWKIVVRLATEDPPPLGAVLPSVPRDLAVVVMKCLERDPARRYDSARALGEDLQRFLDGEPVLARRARLSARLRRKLRRYRLVAAAMALVLAATAVPTAMWIRARRDAEAQARLGQELGHDVAEMEHLMRSAYQMPLHDVERERALVRARLAEIEARMRAAGPPGLGPGHYALGRGYLAVGDAEQAHEHLERARAAGYTPAELDYAQGQALLEVRVHDEWKVAQAPDEAERARRLEIAAQHDRQALERLRAASPARLEHPAYAEALLALHEDRFEEAVAKAREAFARSPMLFDAKRLEGDALAALASRAWGEGKPGWWELMSAHVDAASSAYQAAEDVARSDPRTLLNACRLWTTAMFAANFHGRPRRPPFERARDACERLLRCDGTNQRAWSQRAELHALYAFALTSSPRRGEPPEAAVAEALRAVEEAASKRGGTLDTSAGVSAVLGTALRSRALLDLARGLDAGAALDGARRAYEDLNRAFPGDLTPYQSMGVVDVLTAVRQRRRGADVRPTVEQGFRWLDRGLAAGDGPAVNHQKRGMLLVELAQQLLDLGQSPAEIAARALAEAQAGEAQYPGWMGFARVRADAYRILAAHEIASGGDPRRSLEEAAKEARALADRDPLGARGERCIGLAALLRAEHEAREGRSPEAALGEARAALRDAAGATPWELENDLGLARVELLAARWALQAGRANAATFERARAPLARWLTEERADPDLYALAAESHALAAAWRAAAGRSPEPDLAAGLTRCDQALALNPRHAAALATRDRLRRPGAARR